MSLRKVSRALASRLCNMDMEKKYGNHRSLDPRPQPQTFAASCFKVGLVLQLPLRFYVKTGKSVFTCFINKT